MRHFISVILGPLALVLLPQPAQARSSSNGPVPDPQAPFEVSEDGRQRVDLSPATMATPAMTRGSSPLFDTTPDWMNSQRRQVGGLVAEDMNGDGLVDLVVGCYNSSAFPPYDDWHNFIHYNTGSELEATPSWTSTDQVSSGHVVVGLINDDNFPDVFAVNGGPAMAPNLIYFGGDTGPDTTAGWVAAETSWSNHAVIFDFDHNGWADVATANQGNSPANPHRPMRLFLNTGGTLANIPAWESAETSIQGFLSVGDMDNDGWEDLAVSKWINFETGVYRNILGTLELTPSWTTGDDSDDRGVAWIDLDGDPYPELAIGHDPTQVYDNVLGSLMPDWNATGTFFGPQDMAVCDVDHDGDPDLLEVHFANGVANLYLNEGGTLGQIPAWSYDSSAVGTAIACGDINGDGLRDIIVGNAGDVSILVFYNKSGQLFADGFESGDVTAWASGTP